MYKRQIYVSDTEKLAELMAAQLRDGDMVITQGAGNIGAIARNLAADEKLMVTTR